MTKYYLMAQKVPENGTIIRQMSHGLIPLKTGHFLSKTFKEPFVCQLLGQFSDGIMSTFYSSPAIIGTKQFYKDLVDCGVDNIEVKSVEINDVVKNVVIHDYLLLNFIGKISCAVMDKSDYGAIGEDINIMNKLVIDSKKTHGQNLFLLDEDTDCVVISEQVYTHLTNNGYKDIYFEELEQV